jgi:hypothetical protein
MLTDFFTHVHVFIWRLLYENGVSQTVVHGPQAVHQVFGKKH